MFRQFTWKHKANSGLNFATAQGFFLVVSRKSDKLEATRSKVSLTKLFMIDIARREIPVSGCTCFNTL